MVLYAGLLSGVGDLTGSTRGIYPLIKPINVTHLTVRISLLSKLDRHMYIDNAIAMRDADFTSIFLFRS